MMKRLSIFLAIIAAVALPLGVRAASLDDAHRAFAEGRYHDSTQAYQTVIAEKGYSAPVLFDLGNSYYREGNFAQAILAYKRAQWLAPGDKDIAANLLQAETRAGITPATSTLARRVADKFGATTWAWIGCLAWTLFCLSILARTIQPQRKTLFALSGAVSAMVLAGVIATTCLSSGTLHEAIVTAKDAPVLISPFPAAQKIYVPSPGESLTVEKTYDDFLLVTDPAGHSGWISRAQVTPVIPSA